MSTSGAPAATENHGALKRIKPVSVFSYMLGDFGCNLAFSLGTTWLLFYYTDVAGLSAAAIGTMFLIVRLWDAFADLIAGRAVDSTMTRWGKFRPFILFFSVPLLFLSFLTFHVPESIRVTPENPDAGPALLYAYLTYAVLGLLYSLVNIPFGSLASAMTQSVHERAKLVSWRMWGSAAAGVFLTFIIAPQISALQKESKALRAQLAQKPGDPVITQQIADMQGRLQGIFTQTTLWFIVLGTLCFLMVFFFCRENVVRTQARVTVKETIDTLRSNKPLGILCLASFFYLTGVYAVGPVTAFYATHVLGDISWTTWLTALNVGVSLIITPFMAKVIDKTGKKNLFQYCGIFTIVGGVAIFFTPVGAIALALLFITIKGIGASLINVAMFGLEADTVEYGEWKTGRRSEGTTYAIFSFTRKLTQSIGGALGAWLLALGGYVAGSPDQPESAIFALKAAIGLVPAVCAVLAMIAFWRYPLTDTLFSRLRNENEAKKAERGNLVAGDGSIVDAPQA